MQYPTFGSWVKNPTALHYPGSPSTISNMLVYEFHHFVIKGWQHHPKETTFFEMVATTSMVYRYIRNKINQKNIEVFLQCHLMVRSSSHGPRYLENSRTLDCSEIGTVFWGVEIP